MNRVPFSNQGGHQPTASFNVVITYDDTAPAIRAKQAHDEMVDRIGTDCDFELLAYPVELLEEDSLVAEVAANRAADADAVIISLQDGGQLSQPLRVWVNEWITRRICAQPAVVLLFGDPSTASSILAQTVLQYIGRNAGKSILCQTAAPFKQEDVESCVLE